MVTVKQLKAKLKKLGVDKAEDTDKSLRKSRIGNFGVSKRGRRRVAAPLA